MVVAVWLLILPTAVRAAEVLSGRKPVISDVPDGPKSVFTADLDGDGDLDVLSASFLDDTIRWYRNDGGSWTIRTIASNADSARSVACRPGT
jgi:hypothetical protein